MGRKQGIRIGATIGILGALYTVYKSVTGEGKSNPGAYALYRLTGVDMISATPAWRPREATAGMALIGGIGLSMVASKVGLNRYTPKGINI